MTGTLYITRLSQIDVSSAPTVKLDEMEGLDIPDVS